MVYKYKIIQLQTLGMLDNGRPSEWGVTKELNRLSKRGWNLVSVSDKNRQYSDFYLRKKLGC